MKTINKILLITFFVTITMTNLFAQELQYEPFSESYNFYENSFSNDFSANWLLSSQQDYFPMRDETFSDFILRNNNWLLHASAYDPNLSLGGRPGDFGAYGGIGHIPIGVGHIPIGDGIMALLLIIGIYTTIVFIRKKLRIEEFAL